MEKSSIKTTINTAGNDLKSAIDDIMWIILNIQEDLKILKVKELKPDKSQAKALLEYITMENSEAKKLIKILCGDKIEKYFKWIDEYCKEYSIKREQVLQKIVENESY